MKPFTLRWYLEQLAECVFRMEYYRELYPKDKGIMVSGNEHAQQYQRYQKLYYQIEERIINKYGE